MTAFEINDGELSIFFTTTNIDVFIQKPFPIKQLEHITEKHS
jgi:hypothetical protein